MNHNIRNIAFAGSGNVAWHLAKELLLKGFQITSIWSRDKSHAQDLASACNSVVCDEISGLRNGSEMIIIAVSDNAIENVAVNIGEYDGIVVHSAGSVPLDILKPYFKRFGVIYPLQTFSKDIPANIADVPFFLEGSSADVLLNIKPVAEKLSYKIYETDSRQRLLVHVAAVFAGNYSNLMYVISNELLADSKLPPEVLYPLILETARKATTGSPLKMQTGPARRKDLPTIEKHLEALTALPEYAAIYKLLATQISEKY